MSAYIVKLSDKSEVKIDADEVQNVVSGIQSGQPVKVRRGIFNPSFFVCLIEDVDRLKAWRDDQPAWNSINYGEVKPLQPLQDIFNTRKQIA